MTVVTSFELDDQIAISGGTCEAHGRHGGFRAAVHEAHDHERRHPPPHFLRQLDFRWTRRPIGPTVLSGDVDRRKHGRVRVPEDQGAPGADVVDILPAVDIDETGAVPPRDKKMRPADCPERPYGRIHATGQHPLRPAEELARSPPPHVSAAAWKS